MKYVTTLSALLLLAAPVCADDSLPILHKDDVILFQGDSITDGGRQRSGSDYNHIMGQDYCYILASQIGSQFPERNITFVNRGVGGNKISDLAARWQNDAINLKPNLLSILIGINDMQANVSLEQYEQTYDKLLSDTVAALPGVKIVLGDPFILPVGKWKDHYDDHITDIKKRQEIVARMAEKYHTAIIHYQNAFDDACRLAPADHWSWDGIHPTYAGHGLMVREWVRTVDSYWPHG